MDFKHGLQLNQRLEQRLVMTQQLQQAIRLLQLSRTELLESVREQLLENPLLEEQSAQDGTSSGNEVTGGEGEVTNFDEREATTNERQEIDWQQYFADLARGPSEGRTYERSRDDDRPPLSQTLTRGATLSEILHAQLGVSELDSLSREIAAEVIGNLDGDGYFRPTQLVIRGGSDAGRRLLRRKADTQGVESIEARGKLILLWLTDEELNTWRRDAEGRGCKVDVVAGNSTRAIAQALQVKPSIVHEVLAKLQQMEPLGIACRDLQECLFVQAKVVYPDNEKLHRLIERHLENIEMRRDQPVVRDLKISKSEVRALLQLLATLEPRPGREHSGENASYITPDVHVRKVGDEYTVVVNEDGLPKLRLSRFYKDALLDGKGKEAKDYIQEKMRQATWLIRSIHQRQSTIQRVTESIMRFQRPFLDRGVSALRPLVLREVAEDCGLHESTVSRVTTSKYVDTPQGIFELKYFFNARIETRSGHDMASEAVKHWISKLIRAEQPRAPLSDQEIADILKGEWDRDRILSRLDCTEVELPDLIPGRSMSIARRTVAKYREAMNISSSSRRRQVF